MMSSHRISDRRASIALCFVGLFVAACGDEGSARVVGVEQRVFVFRGETVAGWLTAMVQDRSIDGMYACPAMRTMGESALPDLFSETSELDDARRETAIRAIACTGIRTPRVRESLRGWILNDPSKAVRSTAYGALVAWRANEDADFWCEMLHLKSGDEHYMALNALTLLGEAGLNAIQKSRWREQLQVEERVVTATIRRK